MLDYEKVNEQDGTAVYAFYIEGDRAKEGQVSIKADGSSAKLLTDATVALKRYGYKLIAALEKQADAGALKPSGTLMWY